MKHVVDNEKIIQILKKQDNKRTITDNATLNGYKEYITNAVRLKLISSKHSYLFNVKV